MKAKHLSLATAIALLPVWAVADDHVHEVLVEARQLSIDKLNSVKVPIPLSDVPQSLSIIPSVQIERQAFQNMGDVLRYTPGLAVSQGEGHRDAVVFRGILSTADFYIDGVRDDVQYYRPLYNVEQIEVLRGPNALLFGRGGGGGVINRVAKKATLDEQFTTLKAGIDTFGAYSLAVDTNVETGDRSAFRMNAYYQELENHRDFYDGSSYALNPTFTLQLSDETTAVFSYEYVDDDRVVDRGVPSQEEGDVDAPLEGFDETFFGSPDENYTTLEAHILKARVDHEFSDQLRGNVTAQYADYDKVYQNLYPSDRVVVTNGSFPSVELDGYRDTTERENIIIQTNLVGEFDTGNFGHTVLFGAEYGQQDTENARLDNVFAANMADQLVIPFSDPLNVTATSAFAFTDPARDRESEVTFTSIYLQDQIDVTDYFKLVIGARYDEFDVDVLNNDGGADARFSRKDDEITPRYGFIYKPAENVSVYASYSETFLPQSGDQFLVLNINSESTRPQFFENEEVGVKWDIREDLSLTAAYFELEQESYSVNDPDDPGEILVIGADISGYEIQLVGNITDRWSLTTGYSNLDAEVVGGGNEGNRTRQTPEHMFSVWSMFQLNNSLAFGTGLIRQDDFFTTEDNSVRVPDYTRVDTAVYYTVNDDFSVQLNIENLFDEDYYPDAHSNTNISTGKPVNARLSMTYKL